ncbi:Crossover junction endonuclease mus81 [Coemansia sp. RSA 1722]|nr:Crossover junction endonuclease mus81 [Coemansia sp. RSA 486]KAJ2226443.1 Crossover junction endonuclease mus81 [Coemansia sp. RSA 485]KAJ2594277.1 Crossover junction endonuclease mus81 [Coemansia sp. RSA 1722]KAJ2601052.1 Crossover junction endonuclease mus81 [Coemansia sp. RSA 1721]KAJ2640289.1 Crossover junction endonuclease mus81 [Coemansia sp. RSA 1286]
MSGQEEPECANPLFFKWVSEWHDEACARNSKAQFSLKKACISLQRYPLPIENAQETVQLQGIGQGIADRLAKRLSAWRKENNIPEPSTASAADNEPVSETSRKRSNSANGAGRLYVPRYRSGAFALIIGLLKAFCLYGQDYFVPKAELIPMCEQYTDTPFHVAGGSSHGRGRGRSGSAGSGGGGGGFAHTAWSGMKTLESKGLAERQGGVKFCLTEDGFKIAKKVVQVLQSRGEVPPDDERVFANMPEMQRDSGCEEESASGSVLQINSDTLDPESDYTADGSLRRGPCVIARASSGLLPPLIPRPAASRIPNHNASQAAAGQAHSRLLQRTQSAQAAPSSSPVRQFARHSSTPLAETSLSDLLHYPHDSFDIILIVDNREVRSSSDRSLIERELEEHQIPVEIRPLTVGDYLWIARTKKTGEYRHLPDMVLDHVVERKRMDDLCASIRDGRYKEQHSRIHGTGFTNVLYIVEGNDPEAVSRLGEAAVSSALCRIQVQHGFHLKRPMTFEATLRLLRQNTIVLRETLRDVYAIPDRMVGQKGFAALKKSICAQFPHIHLGLTFDAYDVVSNKSSTLSVGEVYLRMLMSLRGVSADKALAIGRLYQTPRQLMQAVTDEPVKAVGDLYIEGSRRKIGPTLGKRVAHFWTSDEFREAND